jgi:uncharacterized protein (DUF608 family)
MGRIIGVLSTCVTLLCCSIAGAAPEPTPGDRAPTAARGVPLGGLGTGSLTLREDGSIGPLTINNNWCRPIPAPPGSLFLIRVRTGGKTTARALGKNAYSWPAMREVRSTGTYPIAAIEASDAELPVTAQLSAFSPMIPYNLKDSSLPAAIFSVTLVNRGAEPVDAAVALSWENLLGHGGTGQVAWADRRGNTQEVRAVEGLSGIFFTTPQAYQDRRKAVTGNYALLAAATGGKTSQLPYWNAAGDGTDFWGAFTGDTLFGEKAAVRPGVEDTVHPAGAVAGEATIPPGKSQRYDFVLAWYTPNDLLADGTNAGHYYATFFEDAWAVASYALQYRDNLLAGTAAWQDLVLQSSLPEWLRARLLTDAGGLATGSVYSKAGYFAGLSRADAGAPLLSPMERRTAWQPLLTAFFPALDRGELAGSGGLQLASGEIPRMSGILHERYAAAGVPGAGSRRPDVTCGYILQVARHFRWTGDLAFLAAVYPSIPKALAWLRTLDTDGDGIPESAAPGGEQPGTQAYTAGMYLAALRAAGYLAARQRDNEAVRQCMESYQLARRSAIAELWNGQYFNRSFNPATADRSTAADWDQLAGEACAASLDLGSAYGQTMATAAARFLLDDGNRSSGADKTPAAASARFPSLAATTGIWSGDAGAGLQELARLQTKQGDRGTGGPGMADLSSWNVLYALAGASFDEPQNRLVLRPHLPTGEDVMQIPVFGPRTWLWLDCRRSRVNANVSLRAKMVRRTDDRPYILQTLSLDAPLETSAGATGVLVQSARGVEAGRTIVEEGRVTFAFKTPLEWAVGQELAIDLVSTDSNQLLLDVASERAVSMGAPVRVDGLRRERDGASFRLANPTPDRQVVSVRFLRLEPRDYDTYLNGIKVSRLFDNEPRDRLAVVVPASPVASGRVTRLQKIVARLQAARETAYKEGKLPLLEARFDALQSSLDNALRADAAARSVEVALLAPGARPRGGAPGNAADAERAVVEAETALGRAAELGPNEIPDSWARRLLVSAVVPVEARLQVAGDARPRGTLKATVTLANDSALPLKATIDPLLPAGWTAAAPEGVALPPGGEAKVEFSITLPDAVEARRHRVAARATVALPQTSWDLAAATGAGSGFIRAWSVIGPFPNTNDAGLQQEFPPEKEIIAGADYNGRRWRVLRADGDRVNLSDAFSPNTEVLAYAYTRVFSPVEQDAIVELGSHDGVQARLNGQKVFERHEHRDAAPNQDRLRIHLKAGWNSLLLKVEQSTGDWGFYVEITDPSGAAIEGLRLDPEIER